MFYSFIVRKQVKRVFEQINSGNILPMIDGLSEDFVYVFHGEHALGGRRVTKEAMRLWWARAFRLLPGLRFTIENILVSGFPWNTYISIKSTVSGVLPNGEYYENTVFQLMHLRWGKICAVETMENLEVLGDALQVVASFGVDEALAPPING